jgi:hypothetical protein
MESFLAPDYKIPESQSRYLKLQKGDTRIRILSHAVVGFSGWTPENKPLRWRTEQDVDRTKLKLEKNGQPKVGHFWAFPVFNYDTKTVQVFEITQKTIQKAIKKYVDDVDYGAPWGYDIIITKDGDGLETEYTVIAKPPKPMEHLIQDGWEMVKPTFDANRLFDNGDPFGDGLTHVDATAPEEN